MLSCCPERLLAIVARKMVHPEPTVAPTADRLQVVAMSVVRVDFDLIAATNVSEFLSSAFCVVDPYNPSQSRKEYEFDETRLRSELLKVADEHGVKIKQSSV